MGTQRNPNARLEELRAVQRGIDKEFPLGTEKVTIRGKEILVSSLRQEGNVYIVLHTDAEEAHKTLTAKVEARDKAEPKEDDYLARVRLGVVAAFGDTDQRLTSFGVKPKKARKELTAEQQMNRVQKNRRTRELRHTMGPRQKKNIKAGDLPLPPGPANPSTPLGAGEAKPENPPASK